MNGFNFFKRKKIEVFVRYCFYSEASFHKDRYKKFSHEKCFHNLMKTADFSRANFTFFLDTFYHKDRGHFIQDQNRFPIIEIKAGCEAQAFLAQLDYITKQPFSPDTLIYLLEDDYLHRKDWIDILLEGSTIPGIDYVTLFDHRDKYSDSSYKELSSRIFHSESCHWRTTPSTTNTYAMRFETLKKHLRIHREFSMDRKITSDHDKFLKLAKEGAVLISPIPGWSTHVQPEYASPCHEWEEYLV